MKKLIAFDLDGTLTPLKSPIDPHMAALLSRLLAEFQVCIVFGGKFEQFEKRVVSYLSATPEQLERLHVMPARGTCYYVYRPAERNWHQVYSEDFTGSEKQKITRALNKGFDDLGYREKTVYGEYIDDRGSQLTFSAFGQDVVDRLGPEGIRLKQAWDPDNKKKLQLRDYIAGQLPEFAVHIGGTTSIDVTKPGIDKTYGLKKLIKALGITKEEILFIGDRLQPGGSDYPVKVFGIDCIEVSDWRETASTVETILREAQATRR
jgi:HAD superfamily hydrolase (TIGR01484 family)